MDGGWFGKVLGKKEGLSAMVGCVVVLGRFGRCYGVVRRL